MKKKLNHLFMLDLETYLEVCKLAQQNGKKSGESMQQEFEEVIKKKKNKVKYLGATELDIDLLAGNMRENGLKILNMNELNRRKK